MNSYQSMKVFISVVVLTPVAAYAADQVVQNDSGITQMLLAIVTALAGGAVAAAVKSWSDVNVLKKEVERLEDDVEKTAELAYVKECLARIEKRLDDLDSRCIIYHKPS